MAAHLLVLYPNPADPDSFVRQYREEHLPYAGPRLAGATAVATRQVVGPGPGPHPFHLISDISFPDIETMKACAQSQGGQEALAHAASISPGGAPVILATIDLE